MILRVIAWDFPRWFKRLQVEYESQDLLFVICYEKYFLYLARCERKNNNFVINRVRSCGSVIAHHSATLVKYEVFCLSFCSTFPALFWSSCKQIKTSFCSLLILTLQLFMFVTYAQISTVKGRCLQTQYLLLDKLYH